MAKGKSVEKILDSWEEQEGRLERQGKRAMRNDFILPREDLFIFRNVRSQSAL